MRVPPRSDFSFLPGSLPLKGSLDDGLSVNPLHRSTPRSLQRGIVVIRTLYALYKGALSRAGGPVCSQSPSFERAAVRSQDRSQPTRLRINTPSTRRGWAVGDKTHIAQCRHRYPAGASCLSRSTTSARTGVVCNMLPALRILGERVSMAVAGIGRARSVANPQTWRTMVCFVQLGAYGHLSQWNCMLTRVCNTL